ncbi:MULTISPECIES: lipid A export permease/ATP-binding protein MsbA [Janthinobacterium]|uniref:Lipid A export permease/ATP-binding protein MsbA n=1 Tax=Janthinobacterium kumbetense TaxID=2950280 RepID=A0ABT0WUK9_9BURK|nr:MULTISPECIES: lipid A export permease/ATP-binding protein MsbA [Janthinobacterium]MCM2567732.1 lipid A export permease/ATP-binding protein MsbA [Janthinobacterium kumbetense]MDN2673906.1 lipid A export permease/ATP-binding protein MsbA [Janthinobacterium sp. SUN026]MDO8041229.1 lipid A export permease/ATP-binding protein MsbA [Janthinobacterium sp. SUN137]MDO8067511.1 lipid A export permease/ATP-binding protein MsbA [Janthinobacterium sp. SUN206]MDO8070037.1 lipid A export permease/ATP-bind
MQQSRLLFFRLAGQFRRYGAIVAATLLAVGVASATDVLLIRQLQNVVDAMRATASTQAAPASGVMGMLQGWVDRFLPAQAGQVDLWVIPATILGLAVLRMVSSFAGDYGSVWLSSRVQADLREKMFATIMRLPSRFFDTTTTSLTQSRVAFDASQVSQAGLNVLNVMVRDSVATVGYLILLFSIDVKLALFCMASMPIVAIVVTLAGRRMRHLSKSSQQAVGELTSVLDESIGGQRVVKIFGGQDYEQARFVNVVKRNRQLAVKHAATSAMNSGFIMMLVGITLSSVIYFAMLRAQSGAITPGAFVAFMGALMAMQSPIKNLTKINEPLQRGLAAAESVFGLIDTPLEPDPGTIAPVTVQGNLSLQNVNFRYNSDDPDAPTALSDITLDIRAGETVALVGGSGGGKTTLLGLLPRFYDVSGGQILLDGVDLRDYALLALRRQFALVSQDVILFNDTMAANIAYGDPAPDQARIEASARAAYAHDFIMQLPQGYETQAGQNGSRLSGGQRQRLAIARALYKDAPILLLDEATSALDTESERSVQAALEVLMRNRTTIVIAHRLSTIESADRIVVMQGGRLVESGSHATLLQQGGAYARLHASQLSPVKDGAA